jgi:hypothetical protein
VIGKINREIIGIANITVPIKTLVPQVSRSPNMNQKIIESIKKSQVDLNTVQSWPILLEMTEKEVFETQLSKLSPNDLYTLEKEDILAFKLVRNTLSPKMKVETYKVLEYVKEIRSLQEIERLSKAILLREIPQLVESKRDRDEHYVNKMKTKEDQFDDQELNDLLRNKLRVKIEV